MPETNKKDMNQAMQFDAIRLDWHHLRRSVSGLMAK